MQRSIGRYQKGPFSSLSPIPSPLAVSFPKAPGGRKRIFIHFPARKHLVAVIWRLYYAMKIIKFRNWGAAFHIVPPSPEVDESCPHASCTTDVNNFVKERLQELHANRWFFLLPVPTNGPNRSCKYRTYSLQYRLLSLL